MQFSLSKGRIEQHVIEIIHNVLKNWKTRRIVPNFSKNIMTCGASRGGCLIMMCTSVQTAVQNTGSAKIRVSFMSSFWLFSKLLSFPLFLISQRDLSFLLSFSCFFLFTEDGKLTITGSGKMNQNVIGSFPWAKLSVKSIVIGEGVTSISDCAFFNPEDLTDVSMPDTLTSIGNGAFEQCGSLSSITIGKGVSSIGDTAFYASLQSFTVKDGNTHFSADGGVLYNINKTVIISYPPAIDRDQFEIPGSVTTIADYAFSNSKELKSYNPSG